MVWVTTWCLTHDVWWPLSMSPRWWWWCVASLPPRLEATVEAGSVPGPHPDQSPLSQSPSPAISSQHPAPGPGGHHHHHQDMSGLRRWHRHQVTCLRHQLYTGPGSREQSITGLTQHNHSVSHSPSSVLMFILLEQELKMNDIWGEVF